MQGGHFGHNHGGMGFTDTLLVPYDPDTRKVLPIAAVDHLNFRDSNCLSGDHVFMRGALA